MGMEEALVNVKRCVLEVSKKCLVRSKLNIYYKVEIHLRGLSMYPEVLVSNMRPSIYYKIEDTFEKFQVSACILVVSKASMSNTCMA